MIYKVFPKLNHDTAKLTHLILHAIATVLGAFGIYCAFKFHNDSGIANLYSLHSWLGIGTISLYAIQVTKAPAASVSRKNFFVACCLCSYSYGSTS